MILASTSEVIHARDDAVFFFSFGPLFLFFFTSTCSAKKNRIVWDWLFGTKHLLSRDKKKKKEERVL